MVTKSKKIKAKKAKAEKKAREGKEEAMDVDDALSGMDDENVTSGVSKPRKIKIKEKEIEKDVEEAEDELDEFTKELNGHDEPVDEIKIKASKPVAQLKKGDKIKVDGKELEVDSHYVLMDHGTTKEMAIDIFDLKADKDYQLRYFSDQVETSMEFYELQEIMYIRKLARKVEW